MENFIFCAVTSYIQGVTPLFLVYNVVLWYRSWKLVGFVGLELKGLTVQNINALHKKRVYN